MSLIIWRDDLSVAVPEMDAQHKRLIALINNLHAAMRRGRGKEVVGSILEGLAQYTISHFHKEEELMERAGYPKLASQRIQHEAFVKRIMEFQEAFESGRQTVSLDIMTFLRDWLTHHIREEDKAYGPYLAGRTTTDV